MKLFTSFSYAYIWMSRILDRLLYTPCKQFVKDTAYTIRMKSQIRVRETELWTGFKVDLISC